MWIKICANTNVEDARLAAQLGADAVGFVFAESARQVKPAQVAEIVSQLPQSIEKVGVFSCTAAQDIIEVVRQTGINGVQLHGEFDLALARRLHSEFGGSVTLTQVLHWPVDHDAGNPANFTMQLNAIAAESSVHRLLIDSGTRSGSGGTGQSFDWVAAGHALAGFSEMKLILAGGLHPGNVAQAIEELHPWGVDVASGVESVKGRKDPEKLKKFIENANGLR